MNFDQLNESGDLFSDMLHDPDEDYLVDNGASHGLWHDDTSPLDLD